MNENNHLLDVLTREGVLVNVSVRYWRATKKLDAEDLGLNPGAVETRLIQLGHKKLLPKESLQAFALIEGRAHALVDANTFPFLDGLGHFLPNARLEETMGRLTELEREFLAERDAFLDRYAETRVAALAEWREAAGRLAVDPARLVATIEESFPDRRRMERAFGFATQLFQIRVPEGVRRDLVSLAEQQEVIRAREEAARQAAEQIHRGVEGFLADCVASLREQTATLCEEMLESMRSGKTGVHQKTLNRLVRFIDEFKTLNFVGDRELEEQLERVRGQLLSRTAEEYRDSAYYQARLREGLHDLADVARQMAQGDARDLVERFGQIGRRRLQIALPVAQQTQTEDGEVPISLASAAPDTTATPADDEPSADLAASSLALATA